MRHGIAPACLPRLHASTDSSLRCMEVALCSATRMDSVGGPRAKVATHRHMRMPAERQDRVVPVLRRP